MAFQLNEADVPQCFYGGKRAFQAAHAFFALRSAVIVFAAGMFMLDHGVTDDHCHAGWKGEQFVFQRAAIEKNGLTDASKTRSELIHDADTRADKFVFRALAKLSDFRKCESLTAGSKQRTRHGNFQRGRRTQSGAERNITVNSQIRARE